MSSPSLSQGLWALGLSQALLVVTVPLTPGLAAAVVWAQVFCILSAVDCVRTGSGLSLASLGLVPAPWRAVAVGALVGAGNLLALATPIQFGATQALPREWVSKFDTASALDFLGVAELIAFTASTIVLAPLGEELLFRGFLARGLARFGRSASVGLTAFIFAAVHFDPVGLAARFELGIVFGLLAWASGSLWPAIAAHAVHNALSLALYLSARGEFVNAPQAAELAIPSLIGAALLGGAYAVGRDTMWKSAHVSVDDARGWVWPVRRLLVWGAFASGSLGLSLLSEPFVTATACERRLPLSRPTMDRPAWERDAWTQLVALSASARDTKEAAVKYCARRGDVRERLLPVPEGGSP